MSDKILKEENSNRIKKICPYEDLLDEILACHKACRHGGVKKMVKECDKYWS